MKNYRLQIFSLIFCLALSICSSIAMTENRVKGAGKSRNKQAAVELQIGEKPAAQPSEIRRIDFNNFTYQAFCGGSQPDGETTKITIKDGKYEGSGDDFPSYFEADADAYGDLDGDGREEAAVSSLCNTGGTGQFSEGYVYTLKNGKPFLLAHFEGGDRGFGGLQSVRIKNGFLFVERSDGEANCCAEYSLTTKYRWNGEKLVEVGKPVRQKLFSAARIRFDKGKSGKTLTMKFEARETKFFLVGTNAGQIVTVTSGVKNVEIHSSDFHNTESISEQKITGGMKFKVLRNRNFGFQMQNLAFDDRTIIFDIVIK